MIQSQENPGAYPIKKDKTSLTDYSQSRVSPIHAMEIGGIKGFHLVSRYEKSNYPGAMSCVSMIKPIERSSIAFGPVFAPPTPSFIIREKDHEIEYLKQTIYQMKLRLEWLERSYQASPIQVRIVEIRDLPQEEIKKQVLEYYQSHGPVYPSDIADALGLSFEAVFNAVDELVKGGFLEAKSEDEL